MYIHKLNLLIESDEDFDLELEISQELERIISGKKVHFVSSNSKEIYGSNYGRCIVCGCWTSDNTKPHYVNEFSNGAKISKSWYCYICLPDDHPNAF